MPSNEKPLLKILLSEAAARRNGGAIAALLGELPHRLVIAEQSSPGADADVAFVSRDVTGLSTKHAVAPGTAHFYDLLRAAPGLRWVHIHSSGEDRPIYRSLRASGVRITTSSGANARVVAHSAVALLLLQARLLPQLLRAQGERTWAHPPPSGLPRDLEGQTAVLVGWGPIAQHIRALLHALGLRVAVARNSEAAAAEGVPTVPYRRLHELLPQADWLVLACPLTSTTQGLIGAAEFRQMCRGARLVNVARGEIVVEAALVEALRDGVLAGAALDVFAHEPLPPESPLWGMPNVVITPHTAGISDANADRIARLFLENLRRWTQEEPLLNLGPAAAVA